MVFFLGGGGGGGERDLAKNENKKNSNIRKWRELEVFNRQKWPQKEKKEKK
jgi:hypothetical protein